MLVSSVFWDDFKLGQGDDKKKFLAVKFKKPHDMRGVTNLLQVDRFKIDNDTFPVLSPD